MKKSLIALAVLASVAGTASAQSSVTLFGILDANVRQLDNGGVKVKQLGTDGYNSSRLGFRGTEDIGGGLKAGFWIESAINPDDGTSNATRFWHRRATVSLEGGFGEVRLGRDFTPSYTGISSFDVFGDNGGGKFSSILSKLSATPVDTNTRTDNEVQYFLPKNLGGVYGNVAVAAGEGVVGRKYVGGRLGYAGGPFEVSVSYGQTDANAAEDKYKLGTLGGAYNFGPVRLVGSYSQIKFLSIEEKMLIIGATAPVGNGLFRASFGRADISGGVTATQTADADDATLAAVGYVHNLSKRTALYTTYARITNKGAQRFVVIAGGPALTAGGQKSQSIELGLRHSF